MENTKPIMDAIEVLQKLRGSALYFRDVGEYVSREGGEQSIISDEIVYGVTGSMPHPKPWDFCSPTFPLFEVFGLLYVIAQSSDCRHTHH